MITKGGSFMKLIKDRKYYAMLESIIETSYDGIYITDSDADTILVNKSYERITGLNRDKLMGINMRELVKSGVLSESATLDVLKTKECVTIHQRFSTGKSAIVTSSPYFDEEGKVSLIIANVRDVTELENLTMNLLLEKEENTRFKKHVSNLNLQLSNNESIIAEDNLMLELLLLSKRVATSDATIIINGETGTGKEVLARFIYENSMRKDEPFISLNCGAIPGGLIESEFFGYAKGAFTGASSQGRIGVFESAHNGTLFLDEIGELPLSMQVKLLRVLQEGEIVKVGSNHTKKINVRIIAATNRDLEELVGKGLFREDLFFRLNVVPLIVPPLRDRKNSIIPTIDYFMTLFNTKYNFNKSLSKSALKRLYEYSWPGNIRELKNLTERLVITSLNPVITENDLPDGFNSNNLTPPNKLTLSESLDYVEREMIFNVYSKHKNVRAAAKELGISASTFVRKRNKHLANKDE